MMDNQVLVITNTHFMMMAKFIAKLSGYDRTGTMELNGKKTNKKRKS